MRLEDDENRLMSWNGYVRSYCYYKSKKESVGFDNFVLFMVYRSLSNLVNVRVKKKGDCKEVRMNFCDCSLVQDKKVM